MTNPNLDLTMGAGEQDCDVGDNTEVTDRGLLTLPSLRSRSSRRSPARRSPSDLMLFSDSSGSEDNDDYYDCLLAELQSIPLLDTPPGSPVSEPITNQASSDTINNADLHVNRWSDGQGSEQASPITGESPSNENDVTDDNELYDSAPRPPSGITRPRSHSARDDVTGQAGRGGIRSSEGHDLSSRGSVRRSRSHSGYDVTSPPRIHLSPPASSTSSAAPSTRVRRSSQNHPRASSSSSPSPSLSPITDGPTIGIVVAPSSRGFDAYRVDGHHSVFSGPSPQPLPRRDVLGPISGEANVHNLQRSDHTVRGSSPNRYNVQHTSQISEGDTSMSSVQRRSGGPRASNHQGLQRSSSSATPRQSTISPPNVQPVSSDRNNEISPRRYVTRSSSNEAGNNHRDNSTVTSRVTSPRSPTRRSEAQSSSTTGSQRDSSQHGAQCQTRSQSSSDEPRRSHRLGASLSRRPGAVESLSAARDSGPHQGARPRTNQTQTNGNNQQRSRGNSSNQYTVQGTVVNPWEERNDNVPTSRNHGGQDEPRAAQTGPRASQYRPRASQTEPEASQNGSRASPPNYFDEAGLPSYELASMMLVANYKPDHTKVGYIF